VRHSAWGRVANFCAILAVVAAVIGALLGVLDHPGLSAVSYGIGFAALAALAASLVVLRRQRSTG
jgi:hypothetical protein